MPGWGRLQDIGKNPADSHGCNSCAHSVQGPAVGGSGDVYVNGRNALRKGDPGVHSSCCGPNKWNAKGCSSTVFANGKGAHRKGDATQHCGGIGKLDTASDDVYAGG